jgi:hypothetical protein
MAIVKVLSGHYSVETSLLQSDYPYSFTLRCQRRCWIEYKHGKGYRFVTQTSNPKRPGTAWNTPKKSTYTRFGMVLYLDEQDHVQWTGVGSFDELPRYQSFLTTYGETLPAEGREELEDWIKIMTKRQERRVAGEHGPFLVSLGEFPKPISAD